MAVTRKDVAELAGVSPGVVSYVLNDGPRPVATETRRRVLEAVRELGYRPDGLARSLRMGRTMTLGLVVPDASNPFFAELARAIESSAYARGHAVMVCNSADDPVREHTYIRSLADRRIDGLILVSASSEQDLSDVIGLSIPVVALDRTPDESPISTIRSDNERGAFLGATHLIDHGHRRIAFVGGADAAVTAARRHGWRQALVAAGLKPCHEHASPFTYEGGRDAALALFGGDRSPRSRSFPTAALVASDVQALGLLSGLASRGRPVPASVAVISFDGTNAGQYAVPPLTSIAQPIAEMAERAVSHLVEAPTRVVHMTLQTTLIIGRSCGCL